VLLAFLALAGCRHGRCVASSPAVHGSDSSCCSAPARYYWTGTRCEADSACECDAQSARPSWSTLQACEENHLGCADDDGS
jgi:hypothetical protein